MSLEIARLTERAGFAKLVMTKDPPHHPHLTIIIDIFTSQTKRMNNDDSKPDITPNENLGAEKKPLNAYAKYTGVAFQMMAIIGASAFIGFKIDQYYDHRTQWVTALACVLGVCLSIYQTIRQLKQ